MREFTPPYGLFKQDTVSNRPPIERVGWSVDPETRALFVEMKMGENSGIYEQLRYSPEVEELLNWMSDYYSLPLHPTYNPEPYASLNFNNDEPHTPISALQLMNRSGGFLKAQRTMHGFEWSTVEMNTLRDNSWGIDENGHLTGLSTLQQQNMREVWVQSEAWNALHAMRLSNHPATQEKKNRYIPPMQEYAITAETQLTRVLQLIDELNILLAQQQFPTCYIYPEKDKIEISYYLQEDQLAQLHSISKDELVHVELDQEMYENKREEIKKLIHDFIPMFVSRDTRDDVEESLRSSISALFEMKLSKILISKFLLPSQHITFFVDYSFE